MYNSYRPSSTLHGTVLAEPCGHQNQVFTLVNHTCHGNRESEDCLCVPSSYQGVRLNNAASQHSPKLSNLQQQAWVSRSVLLPGVALWQALDQLRRAPDSGGVLVYPYSHTFLDQQLLGHVVTAHLRSTRGQIVQALLRSPNASFASHWP